MARILAVDYGTKYTGLAVTDPLSIIATPLTTVRTHELEDFLQHYFIKESVTTIVVGKPIDTYGKPTHATEPVKQFVRKLNTVFPHLNVVLHDERYTSKMASQAILQAGMKKKDRQNKQLVDVVSATIILQSYLSKKNL